MADNAIPFALDDISGTLHPRVKVEHGADGAAVDTSYTDPLPTTTALRSDVIFIGSVSATPVYAIISASASSNVQIVAAITSAKIRVLSYAIMMTGATGSVAFRSSGTPLTGTLVFDPYGGMIAPFSPVGHFETAVGQPLKILVGDSKCAGHLTYVAVSV